MTAYHRLARTDLTALASGLGGAATVRELAASRTSRHLLLLRFVADAWPLDRAALDTAVGALAETQRRDRAAYASLLGDPLTGAWLARLTRAIRAGRAEPGDFLHLGNLAAAAAVRAGLDLPIPGYARGGRVALPGVGTVARADPADAPVTIDRTLLAGQLLPLRHLTAPGVAVPLDDTNPYRAGYHAPPADRLPDAEVATWQTLFTQAWALLATHQPDRAAELAAGLRTLIPLVDAGDGSARSGTARDSPGAMGLTRPRSAADFAITLVHEFQHSKLSALLDLVPLYQPGGTELHFAPWRTDPRPTSGLIQGVYAFLGVAATWHALLTVEAPAAREFATVRAQVRVGLEALEASAELTAEGRFFTAGMRTALDDLLAVPLPTSARHEAERILTERRAAWRSPAAGPTG